MFGAIRNNYRNSPSAHADTDLSRSRNLLKTRGATLLLVLVITALGIGIVSWRASLASQAQLPQTTTIDNTVQIPQLPIDAREEQGIVMDLEEQAQSTTTSNTTTNVQVNGETIDLPPSGNGSVYREVISEDGSVTTIDIDMNSSTTGLSKSTNSSTLRLDIQSS